MRELKKQIKNKLELNIDTTIYDYSKELIDNFKNRIKDIALPVTYDYLDSLLIQDFFCNFQELNVAYLPLTLMDSYYIIEDNHDKIYDIGMAHLFFYYFNNLRKHANEQSDDFIDFLQTSNLFLTEAVYLYSLISEEPDRIFKYLQQYMKESVLAEITLNKNNLLLNMMKMISY